LSTKVFEEFGVGRDVFDSIEEWDVYLDLFKQLKQLLIARRVLFGFDFSKVSGNGYG
jgi:hypothetical protein